MTHCTVTTKFLWTYIIVNCAYKCYDFHVCVCDGSKLKIINMLTAPTSEIFSKQMYRVTSYLIYFFWSPH
jgi:hypothetical protein